MITIQELHAYKNLANMGLAPQLVCPIDSLHDDVFPWIDTDSKICLWCVFCNSKVYLGTEKENYIKELLHP